MRADAITAPAGTDLAKTKQQVATLLAAGVDIVNIADGPRASARMGNLAVCARLAAETAVEPILHVCTRDRNFLGLVAHLLGAFAADQVHGSREIDVLVVVAHGRLGRRGEDRLGQLLRLLQAFRQLDAADFAAAPVVLPAAADDVAAGDAFHRYRGQLLGHHRALRVQRRVHAGRQHGGDIDAGQVVGDDVRGPVEPEIADLAEHLALARDRVGQHHVERAQAVGGDHQQVAIAQVEHVADLAAVDQVQAGQVGLQQRGGHARGGNRGAPSLRPGGRWRPVNLAA